jgi:hypothetical protein
VALVRKDILEEHTASIIRVKIISKIKHQQLATQMLVTVNIVTSLLILFTLMLEAIRSSKTSVLTRATLRHIPDDSILQEYDK